MKMRCPWCESSDIYRKYHDEEWGVPVHDDNLFFEFLVLESAQAELSWITILKRREGYRNAFAGFNPKIVANFNEANIENLMRDTSIIRNRRKIIATIANAKAFLTIKTEFGSFDNYIWQFTNKKPIINHFNSLSQVPAQTDIAIKISKDLKMRGFTFVGPTIVYSFMQATGLVNDHIVGCYRHSELSA